ncbi:four helix bundle protein [Bacteroides sp. 519]|uniref:four helix bundle protein n=1 Tax=Bacteroides sp. 519 TaxID=2302937 RepID=UPI0013CF56D1|nr:four helix bundle protein [Bacteroides sp. 519]NDV59167.1 four helix bundle protein [Bacteroides sp. 519]
MCTTSFENLLVWQKAHTYVLMVYNITKKYPKEEMFGLSNQMRRAAASITANIAEGFVRAGKKEKLRFYNISLGSLEETKNFIILSRDLGYITPDEKNELYSIANEVGKLLNSYSNGLLRSMNV